MKRIIPPKCHINVKTGETTNCIIGQHNGGFLIWELWPGFSTEEGLLRVLTAASPTYSCPASTCTPVAKLNPSTLTSTLSQLSPSFQNRSIPSNYLNKTPKWSKLVRCTLLQHELARFRESVVPECARMSTLCRPHPLKRYHTPGAGEWLNRGP
jgi:hypothetical protein